MKLSNFSLLHKILIIMFGFFASSLVVLHSLSLASHKDFWIDEVYEFAGPLSYPVSQMWLKGVPATPSAAPLYFTAEKIFLPPLLKKERHEKSGFDWRVSLRIVSATGLALGVFLAFLLLLEVNALLACGLPVFLCCQNFALYYGAETRIYGPWLGFTLALYSASVAFCFSPAFLPQGLIWIFLCSVVTLLSISSPILIFLLAASMALSGFLIRKGELKKYFLSIGIGLFLTLCLFLFYRTFGSHFSFDPIAQNFTKDFIFREGLRMLEGPKKTFELAFEILILLFGSRFFQFLTFRKIYLVVGLISLGQILAICAVFIFQFGSGYFYSPRHAIFAVAIQALVSACMTLMVFDFGMFVVSKFISKKKRARIFLGGLIIFLSFLNWINWRVSSIPTSLREITTSYKSYCHGPILLPEELRGDNSKGLNPERFNRLNEDRHSGHCAPKASGTDASATTFDFSPEWIYGNSN